MELLIAGSRNYNNYTEFKLRVDKLLSKTNKDEVRIIEGGARGADRLARRYAQEHGLRYVTVEADWDKHGKAAGMIRNEKMAEMATHAILFWDGESRGTKNMKELCELHEIKFIVIKVKVNEHPTTNHQTSQPTPK